MRTAVVIPVLKPGKDGTDPKNYRPIALTSCVCKRNNILTECQSGFRKHGSTVDHLVRLDYSIREAFIRKNHLVSAHDTTWKYGILSVLFEAGLKGRLPMFIKGFLAERAFKVRLGYAYSDIYSQETEVHQGSILSVTLFSLNKLIPLSAVWFPLYIVPYKLYVDYFVISCSAQRMGLAEHKIQQCLIRMV